MESVYYTVWIAAGYGMRVTHLLTKQETERFSKQSRAKPLYANYGDGWGPGLASYPQSGFQMRQKENL